jgi:hypothetical protein
MHVRIHSVCYSIAPAENGKVLVLLRVLLDIVCSLCANHRHQTPHPFPLCADRAPFQLFVSAALL